MNSYSRLRHLHFAVPANVGRGSFEKVAVLAGLADALNLKTFVAIGVQGGETFLPLAFSFSERDGYSYGVDPYEGVGEAAGGAAPGPADPIGDDALYQEVVGRQIELELHRSSNIIRQTFQAAVHIFAEKGVRPDMIHVGVRGDVASERTIIESALAILQEGGVLVLERAGGEADVPSLTQALAPLTSVHQTETLTIFMKGDLAQGELVRLGDECRKIEDEVRTFGQSARTGHPPKVSVSMITYNQERYIAKAIESALEQVTDFAFEIVIGEDASTDRTRDICLEYQRRYPDIIRVVERRRNVGAVRNYLDNYKLCEGRYVAFLEGDDFWIDPYKLQRQVDFLDTHPDYVICCHNVHVADEKGELGELLLRDIPDTTTVHDLVKMDYVATAACMVRNGLVRPIPGWIYDLPGCDWPFDILNAEHGLIKFLPEPMAAYRRHSSSLWSSLDRIRQNHVAIDLMIKINRGLEYRYDMEFERAIEELRRDIAHSQRTPLERFVRSKVERLRSMSMGGLLKRTRSRAEGIRWVVRTDPYSVPGRALRKVRNSTPAALRPLGRPVVSLARRLSKLIRDRKVAAARIRADLIVLDNAYPHPQSAFRLEEFNVYLDQFPDAKVLTTGAAFYFFKPLRTSEEVIAAHARQNPRFKGRVGTFDRSETIEARLAYMVFAGNAWENVEFVERNAIPFVFSLYPGGSFLVDDEGSDARLRRVFESPYFRGVIVTQTYTKRYLVERNLCPVEKIHFVYGIVTPRVNLLPSPRFRSKFGFGKRTLDICFTAHKYMPDGHDKGYDIFLDVARRLVSRFPECRFHVVGGFEAGDLSIAGLEDKITFYGGQEPDWFADFYEDKDLILLCNVPFVLAKGAFDGFPVGCGSDAMLHELALFCTDPLNLNTQFQDGRDLVIVPHDAESIAEKIGWYHANPAALRDLGEKGAAAAREVYSFEQQMNPRLEILRSELET